MKFAIGDANDTALCVALKHEFLRCDDAFKEFASAGTAMINEGENRRIAYTAYNGTPDSFITFMNSCWAL